MFKLLFRFFAIFALLCGVTACVKNEGPSQGADWVEKRITKKNKKMFSKAEPITGGFTENERVNKDGNFMGITPDGAKYAYTKKVVSKGILGSLVNVNDGNYGRYSYNSMFGTWNSNCGTNPMSDRSECTVSYNDSIRLYGASLDKLTTLCLSNHDFPGRRAAIRIDGGRQIDLGEDGCASSRSLVKKLLNANAVAISYVEWPYDSRKDYNLMDFSTNNVKEYLSFLAKAF
jgi:hypothetical protein